MAVLYVHLYHSSHIVQRHRLQCISQKTAGLLTKLQAQPYTRWQKLIHHAESAIHSLWSAIHTLLWYKSVIYRGRQGRFYRPTRVPPLPSFHSHSPSFHSRSPTFALFPLAFALFPLMFALFPLAFALFPLAFVLFPLAFALFPLTFALFPLAFAFSPLGRQSHYSNLQRPTLTNLFPRNLGCIIHAFHSRPLSTRLSVASVGVV